MFIGVITQRDNTIAEKTRIITDMQTMGNHPLKLKCWNDDKENSPIAAPTNEIKLSNFRPNRSIQSEIWRKSTKVHKVMYKCMNVFPNTSSRLFP